MTDTTAHEPTTRAWRTNGSVEAHIEAPPATVYRAVADVTRTGERSPECHTAEWLPGAPPASPGSRFRGLNRSGRIRWTRTCEVLVADPDREFTFRTVPEPLDPSRRDSTTWRYTFDPDGTGTRVTHSYEITRLPSRPLRYLYGRLMPHHRDMRPHMAETLRALEEQVEADR